MAVFWRRGYVASAMSDIYAATGLKPGNLYATFRDKEGLFQAAFETYAKQFRATLPQGVKGRAAIIAWLRTQADLATRDPERRGCLIINTITEREAHSPSSQALAQARLREIRDFFSDNLAIAIRDDEMPGTADRDRLADALVGAVVAIMSLARAGAAEAMIRHVAEQAIASLYAQP
jgi:TetR/AcrR family transcriptional repressor of nem operon